MIPSETLHFWYVCGAMFVSEQWECRRIQYTERGNPREALYAKTRAVVVHDRALTDLYDDIPKDENTAIPVRFHP